MNSLFIPLPQNSRNKFVPLTTTQEVLDHWAFFSEGLTVIRNPHGARGDVSNETFLKIVLEVVARGPQFGLVGILTSPNDKLLGYGVIFDNTEPFCNPSAIAYIVYSNKKCPTTSSELLYHAELWAKKYNFKEIHACSRRFSGAAFRLFENLWNFRRACIVFRKQL